MTQCSGGIRANECRVRGFAVYARTLVPLSLIINGYRAPPQKIMRRGTNHLELVLVLVGKLDQVRQWRYR